jgi:hypothetical protein
MSKDHRQFIGPLFEIGMPRSGTKLLGNLLNQHSKIAIDTRETDFLPLWVNQWDRYGDLSDKTQFKRFYRKTLSLRYQRRLARLGCLVSCDDWYAACRSYDPSAVFEALLRLGMGAPYDSPTIWGDKTPTYLAHIPLLQQLYPHARFVHIIRDVRDYCLSLKHAWNKSMVRAAQRWVDDITKARADGLARGSYLELTFEGLLDDPAGTLNGICEFLELEFEPGMEALKRGVGGPGDARNKTYIVRNNQRKYVTRMAPRTRQRIESIAGELLSELGYEVQYDGPLRRVGPMHLGTLRAWDAVNLVRHGVISNASDFVRAINRR